MGSRLRRNTRQAALQGNDWAALPVAPQIRLMTGTSQTVPRGTTVSKYTRLLRICVAGSPNPRQPLLDWILECYDCVRQQLCDQLEASDTRPQAIEREAAIKLALEGTDIALEPEGVEYAIKRLLDRGCFYEVDGRLRLTVPEKQCSS